MRAVCSSSACLRCRSAFMPTTTSPPARPAIAPCAITCWKTCHENVESIVQAHGPGLSESGVTQPPAVGPPMIPSQPKQPATNDAPSAPMSPPCHAPAAPATSWTKNGERDHRDEERAGSWHPSRASRRSPRSACRDGRERRARGSRVRPARRVRAAAAAGAPAAECGGARPGRGTPTGRRVSRGGQTPLRRGRARAARAGGRRYGLCAITSSSPSITNCQTRSGTAQTCASTCWCSSEDAARETARLGRSSRTVEKMAVNAVSATPPMSRPAVCARTGRRPPSRAKPPGRARPDPGDDEHEAGDEHPGPEEAVDAVELPHQRALRGDDPLECKIRAECEPGGEGEGVDPGQTRARGRPRGLRRPPARSPRRRCRRRAACSVMPVRNEVRAAEIMMPPTLARFSGRAAPDGQGGRGQAPHLEQIAASQVAGGGVAAMKRSISPRMTLPVSGSTYWPAWKKNGTFQTWCRPKGISERSTTP